MHLEIHSGLKVVTVKGKSNDLFFHPHFKYFRKVEMNSLKSIFIWIKWFYMLNDCWTLLLVVQSTLSQSLKASFLIGVGLAHVICCYCLDFEQNWWSMSQLKNPGWSGNFLLTGQRVEEPSSQDLSAYLKCKIKKKLNIQLQPMYKWLERYWIIRSSTAWFEADAAHSILSIWDQYFFSS